MSSADGDEHEDRANGELSPPSYESLDPGTPPPYSARTLGLFGTPKPTEARYAASFFPFFPLVYMFLGLFAFSLWLVLFC